MFRIAPLASALVLVFAGAAHAQTDAEVAARLTPDFRRCAQGADEATWPQALCYVDEQTRQDHRLDQAWVNAAKRLPSARRDAFGRDQDAWIKARKEKCREAADDLRGATAAFELNACMTLEAIRRTIWLEKRQ